MRNSILNIIDPLKCFCEEDGSLFVPGSIQDVNNLIQWINSNKQSLKSILVWIDSHQRNSIFFPEYWVDKNGNHPNPMTQILYDDVLSKKWRTSIKENQQRAELYIKYLQDNNRDSLMIWPYHALEGTDGKTIIPELYQAIVDSGADIQIIPKGTDTHTEHYGIFKTEFNANVVDFKSHKLINQICNHEKIFWAGEAKSHCVLFSIEQFVEEISSKTLKNTIFKKCYILNSCMSTIPGFEERTEKKFQEFMNLGMQFIN